MNITELREELNRQATDLPDLASVRAEADRRVAVHARRRRRQALIAAAAAVVVVAGGAGIVGAVLSHGSAGPAEPTPVVRVPDVPLPTGSRLVRHRLQPVTSPVTATVPEGLTSRVWLSTPGMLGVAYDNPHPSAVARGTASYSPVDPTSQSAGYVVTDNRSEPLTSLGPKDGAAATVSRTSTTVAGHAATVDTAPAGTTDRFGFPASKRISWQLDDGRWIHVWAKGFDDPDELRSFAAGITAKPQTLDRTVGIGLTLPGLTTDSSTNVRPTAVSQAADVYLCPAGVHPVGPSSGSASGYASLNPDGSTTTHQTETSTDPSGSCITAMIMNVPAQQRTSMEQGTTAVTVGGTVTHVDTQHQAAWADLDHGAIAVVRAPTSARLGSADLAALVASVRLAPGVTVTPESDAQASAPEVSGSGSASTAPSTLPTARTTISGTSDLTGGPATPITAPISITADQQYIQSEWQVFTNSGSITVSHRVGPNGGPDFGMGVVIYRSSGLENVPPSATDTTVDGHPAKMWNNGGKIGWTLPDGTGVTVTTGVEKDSRTLAGWIETRRHPVTVGMEPSVTPRGWTVTSSYVAGIGETGTLQLCPADHGDQNSRCLMLRRIGADTTTDKPIVGAEWRVATVGSRTVYVAPDGLQMAERSASGTWTTIQAGTSSGLSTADLAAILLSVPS